MFLQLFAAGQCSGVVPLVSPLAGKILGTSTPGLDGQCARDTALVEEAAANRTLWAVRSKK